VVPARHLAGRLKALKVAGVKDSSGDCERLLGDARRVPQARVHRQLRHGGVGRHARAQRRHPRRRQPRAGAVLGRLRRQCRSPEGPPPRPQDLHVLRRQGPQGGARPPLRHLHRSAESASDAA
jgi:hypothetical protein